jgi:uncharacterized protein
MKFPCHQLSPETFTALASGSGGRSAVQELAAAEHSKHMILLAGVVRAAEGGEQYQSAKAGYDLLAAAWQEDRAAAEQVIRYPTVGAWARRTIQACAGGPAVPGAEPGGLRLVAAAAAIRAKLTTEIDLPVRAGAVMLPSLGAAIATNRSVRLRTTGGRAALGPVDVPEYPHQDAPGWVGLHRVHAGPLDVLIDDLDPFRLPDVPDLVSHLAADPWDTSLKRAWHVLEQAHPVVAQETAAAVRTIVPRSSPSTDVLSTTSPESFGAIGMSLPADPVAGAETLAHEIQHLKLGALQNMRKLTLPDDGRRYYAPWRGDSRPLDGLLQGTYAYLGVTAFWRRQRHQAGSRRMGNVQYARWRAAVALAADTLRSSGGLTDLGLDFVNELARTLAAWHDEPVPAAALAEARQAAESHLSRWQAVNGPVPPA